MTQAAQSLPAHLPSLLTPTPDPSPAVSAATTLVMTDVSHPVSHSPDGNSVGEQHDAMTVDTAGSKPNQPIQQYHIEIPSPLLYNASRRDLRDENKMLQAMIVEVGQVLEQDCAQIKLMDLENERLRKKAFAKDQRKTAKKKFTSCQAQHIKAPEMIDLLA
jgi:hypothetical protein